MRDRERNAKTMKARKRFGEATEEVGSVKSSRASGEDGLEFRERFQRTNTTGI